MTYITCAQAISSLSLTPQFCATCAATASAIGLPLARGRVKIIERSRRAVEPSLLDLYIGVARVSQYLNLQRGGYIGGQQAEVLATVVDVCVTSKDPFTASQPSVLAPSRQQPDRQLQQACEILSRLFAEQLALEM